MELLDTQKGTIIILEGGVTRMNTRKKYTPEYKKEIVKLVTGRVKNFEFETRTNTVQGICLQHLYKLF